MNDSSKKRSRSSDSEDDSDEDRSYTAQAHQILRPRFLYYEHGHHNHYGVDVRLPRTQFRFLREFNLFRPELARWLAEEKAQHTKVDWGVRRALECYVGSDSDTVYQWYNQHRPVDHPRIQIMQQFDAYWSNPSVSRTLPRGTIVFEGQSGAKDLVAIPQSHVLHRARPTSSSWHLNVALFFAIRQTGQRHIHESPTLVVHEIDDETVQAIHVPGQLGYSPQEHEFELVLQPGLRIEVVRVLSYKFQVHNALNIYQAMMCNSTVEITVKFTRVTRL